MNILYNISFFKSGGTKDHLLKGLLS